VDLIYIDPPFNTGQTRRLQSIRLGAGELRRRGFAGKSYRYRIVSDMAYRDAMPLEEYLSFLRQRISEGWRILKPTGSFFLHVDPRIVHYARFLMDEIFGPHRFINEIIWAYDYGGRPRDRFPWKHDNILWYAKSDTWTFNVEEIERIPYMAPGLVGPEKAARGKLPTDVWWITIVPTNSPERTGYPTQKPEKLLERILRAATKPGDLVVDYFAGSGTTGVVAQRLGRHWILVDNHPQAIAIMEQRLARCCAK
jgi:site-specific DNA-methyltransferase (adenine-specific)